MYCELIIWNYVVPNTGQWDLRLVVDPNNAVDERDESNNNHYMMVTGASVSGVGVVTSFAPGIIALLLTGLAYCLVSEEKDYSSSQLTSSSSAKSIISWTSSSFSGSTCAAFNLRFLRSATSAKPGTRPEKSLVPAEVGFSAM